MLNKIVLQGRLVTDPELKNTPSGVAVATFRIAVDRDCKDKETGEKETDFVTVVAWRSTAEFLAKYIGKGRMVLVEGRLRMRNYTDREGNKRTAAEVVADYIYFGDSKPSGGGSAPNPGAHEPAGEQFAELSEDDGELPF